MDKIRIYDSAFTPVGKSASLREENKDVSPTHFEWEENRADPVWFTDGEIRWISEGYEIAWLLEPRCLRPENYEIFDNPDYGQYIKTILTYDKELLNKFPDKTRFYPFGGSSIAFNKWGMYPKSKEICMIVSDKQTTEGHKLRHEIANSLGNWVDCYGAGVGKPFDSKFEILKDYKYCVVAESCRADWYFTEKLIDPISVGTIPIYRGCPGIDKFFDVMQFQTIKELEVLINNLYFTERSAPSYRFINMERAKKYRICEDHIYENDEDLFS